MTIRKPVEDLETVMPLFWMTCGSCDCTSCSLFCVCTWAVSALAPLVKVSVIEACPVEVDVAVM